MLMIAGRLNITDRSGVLLISHGSRDPGARADFIGQVAALSAALAPEEVRSAVLEFPGADLPSIQDAMANLAGDGFAHVIVLPMFLFDAGHVGTDIPAELAQARLEHPGLQTRLLPQIEVSDGVLDVLAARASTHAVGDGAGHRAVMLVGAGTSTATANAELYRVGRLLWEQGVTPLVEIAFVSLTGPSVADGLARCAALGARQVVILPYFLNTGVLARRILPAAEKAAADLGLRVHVTPELGSHPALISALADRVRRAIGRNTAMCNDEQAQNDQSEP
jgi:sirohydrochlorin cobaltochelatase